MTIHQHAATLVGARHWAKQQCVSGQSPDRGRFARPLRYLCAASALLLSLSIVACSKPAPEARLEETGDALDSVANGLADVDEQIQKLESKLAKQRKQRRKLSEVKLTLEERLERRATDVALFRAVQSKLLSSDRLKDSAITVSADDRKISLQGLVDSSKKEATAIAIAQSVAGVIGVDSRLEVDAPKTDSTSTSGA